MPSYLFEVTTEQGVERHSFTLDDDRPLGPQVTQVLEELRLRGVMLRGAHSDELAVIADGRELNLAQRPVELGMSTARPVQLRMRERVADPIADQSLPRGVLASSVMGYLGALAAWILVSFWTDTTGLLATYARLDVAVMLVLGALVGSAVLGGMALRTRGAILLGIVAGALLGATSAAAAAALTVTIPPSESVRGFLLIRFFGWSLGGTFAAAFLAAYARPFDSRRVGESALLGLLAGAVGGALFALPGPSELWQGLAFMAFGTGIGFAVGGPLLWGARAVIEAAPTGGLVPTVLSLREWPVHEGAAVMLGQAQVACQAGQLALYPPATGAQLDGRSVTQPAFVNGSGRLTVDGVRYRIRVPSLEP
jgi:hypothetical protein